MVLRFSLGQRKLLTWRPVTDAGAYFMYFGSEEAGFMDTDVRVKQDVSWSPEPGCSKIQNLHYP
jgi:hypothetical protein